MSSFKPIIRRPKAAEDVEHHATYIADGSIDAALRFLERAEQTVAQLAAQFFSLDLALAGDLLEGFENPVQVVGGQLRPLSTRVQMALWLRSDFMDN